MADTTSRKRKRESSKRSGTPNNGGNKNQDVYDEEISGGSDTDEEQGNVSVGSDNEEEFQRDELSSDEEFGDENAADKRRRLAKQYLDNLKAEQMGEYDFDAQDLDDDIVATRLQKDVAENKGFVYKFYASSIEAQIEDIKSQLTRIGSKHLTGISIRYPFLYTVSKDMELIKWDISQVSSQQNRKPKRIRHTKGGSRYVNLHKEPAKNGHHDSILCVSASPDGRYVVTGGKDKKLIIWSTENLSPLKVLDTRAEVLSMTFRRGTDQLYASCSDLKIRTFSINQYAQLEVLYGHQDAITGISALTKETCVSVGSRDKTAMFWKIAEETRLTFRGGESEKKSRKKSRRDGSDAPTESTETFYAEGSIDCVSMIDDSHFVTGSDNGNISLWSLAKKKPIFSQRISHGLQPELQSSEASAEADESIASNQIPLQQPYWVTCIRALPYSNIFVSGSWNNELKIWKLDENLRSFSLVGSVNVKGCVTDIDLVDLENDERVIKLFAVVSKEHRLGRWLPKTEGGRSALYSCTFDLRND